jgi:hypothetical protein
MQPPFGGRSGFCTRVSGIPARREELVDLAFRGEPVFQVVTRCETATLGPEIRGTRDPLGTILSRPGDCA